MNEKIKQLAQEAGFDFDVHGSSDGNFYGWEGRWINEDLTKLVELVVSECAKIAELKEQGYSKYYSDVSVGWYIRQYFGVEE